jgi:hypothetical protein
MRFSLRLIGDKMNESVIECRYQEYNSDWQMTMYNNGDNTQSQGWMGGQPPWLQLILDVAKVGGHLKLLHEGPPDAILWFKVNEDYNLLEITFP